MSIRYWRWKRWRVHRKARREALESLRRLPLLQAHFVDIKVRVNGQDKWFQGDFLKWLR